ncbi:MAG: hypothetical protein DRP56_08750, partial [Planctomycetota bacterium]
MSIIAVTEEIKSASCSISTNEDGTLNGGGNREFIVLFDEGDSPANRPYLARDADDIPSLWDSHPYETYIYVVDKTVAMYKGAFAWKVTVKYDHVPYPLDEPYTVDWLFSTVSE